MSPAETTENYITHLYKINDTLSEPLQFLSRVLGTRSELTAHAFISVSWHPLFLYWFNYFITDSLSRGHEGLKPCSWHLRLSFWQVDQPDLKTQFWSGTLSLTFKTELLSYTCIQTTATDVWSAARPSVHCWISFRVTQECFIGFSRYFFKTVIHAGRLNGSRCTRCLLKALGAGWHELYWPQISREFIKRLSLDEDRMAVDFTIG